MVRPTEIRYGTMKTFGYFLKPRSRPNHRKSLRHQKFQVGLDPEEIVEHYSKEDYYNENRRAGERSFMEATQHIGRQNLILPKLSAQDLEINHMYQQELNRQRAIIARVGKIRVLVDSKPGNGTELMMNKGISTPYDCARHVHELVASRSVVAQLIPLESELVATEGESSNQDAEIKSEDTKAEHISGSATQAEAMTRPVVKQARPVYWDMHRPLEEGCRIKFRHFAESDVSEVNKIYWRSCSFILGMAVRLAFKDEIKVLLHSWPKPNIKSGSFVYDVALSLSDTWKPEEQELRAFTKIMWNIKNLSLPFDRLRVDRELAKKLFHNNPFKSAQIDSILENESSQGKITVYRCGGFLDISIGPMISNTSQIGRITLTNVHSFESEERELDGVFYRFQGVSLPQQLPVSSYLYQNVLINKAKQLNTASL